jgi:hypothetical protein
MIYFSRDMMILQIFLSQVYFFFIFPCIQFNAITLSGCLMKQWRCAVVVGRCSGMGHRTLVAGPSYHLLTFLPCILPTFQSFTFHNHGSSAGIR